MDEEGLDRERRSERQDDLAGLQRYLAGWTGSCYGIAVEYRQYEVVIPGLRNDNASFGIAVTLKNVGTVGTH